MRLRSKLSIVFALLVFTLAANVALSIWSIQFLERELSVPLQSMQSVMKRLHVLKRSGEIEIDSIAEKVDSSNSDSALNQDPSGFVDQSVHAQIAAIEIDNIRILDELEQLPEVMLRSGVTTIENLRERSLNIDTLNRQWATSLEDADARRLIKLIDNRHELIELIEGQILDDAQIASNFGSQLKSRMHSIILVTLFGALAIGVLMVMFIRKWIFSPIEQLREGAVRMGQGDFGNLIEVHTSDELGQLSDEFNHMGELIQQMQDERVERELLAAMGEMTQRTVHNFRTPLSSIRALSEVLLEDMDEGSESHDFQSRIIATVDRFDLRLNEMLRASAPLELVLKSFNPAELLESIVADHRGAAESKGQTIDVVIDEPPETAQGDAHHLGHAMTAILSNAIEFAPDSSSIQIQMGQVSENEVCYWTFRVANNGPMIPQDLHRSIFRPYFTTRKSGTGIGLAMTQRVTDQHSGRIRIDSPLDTTKKAGCAFTMLIPVNPAVE
ncbi:MAG: HAMP domain-containing histidine kinase [Phycisphaerales bacterium]|nr:HAMP domain-containing histidine kinase [Phycisphaerales bacterium]